jgi:hypothetical protein
VEIGACRRKGQAPSGFPFQSFLHRGSKKGFPFQSFTQFPVDGIMLCGVKLDEAHTPKKKIPGSVLIPNRTLKPNAAVPNHNRIFANLE